MTDGLKAIDRDRVFAQYWTHPEDPLEAMAHKSEKCAEVLVPERVDQSFIVGVWVANETALAKIGQLLGNLQVSINNAIFF